MTILAHLDEFVHDYEATVLTDFPSDQTLVVQIPSDIRHNPTSDLFVAIQRNQKRWIGAFRGEGVAKGLTSIASTPEPTTLCVIATGKGYLVQTDEPGAWTPISLFPIVDIIPVPSHKLTLLVDFTTIGALGPSGFLWRTKRLSWDGIVVTHIGPDYIEGEASDPTSSVPAHFRVDLRSGAHEGGSGPQNK